MYRCPRCDAPAAVGCDHIGPSCVWQQPPKEPEKPKDVWADYGWKEEGPKKNIASGEDAGVPNEIYCA